VWVSLSESILKKRMRVVVVVDDGEGTAFSACRIGMPSGPTANGAESRLIAYLSNDQLDA